MIGVGQYPGYEVELSGIFAGGMLGLFLLGMVSGIKNAAALTATIIGILIIVWMTLSQNICLQMRGDMRSHLHAHMSDSSWAL